MIQQLGFDIFPGACPPCGNIIEPLLELDIQLKAAGQCFIGFNAHDGEITLAVFGDEHGFCIVMAESGNVILVIAQVCAGTNLRHGGHLSFIQKLYQNFFIQSRKKIKETQT